MDFFDSNELNPKIEELKDYVIKSIYYEAKNKLNDYETKINLLSEENANLKKIKDNIIKEYKEKLDKLNDSIKKAKELRLQELFKDTGMNVILYKADYLLVHKMKKCSKCDSNRYINFKSPSGKILKEECSCAALYKKYIVKKYYMCEFRANNNSLNTPLKIYFKQYFNDRYSYEFNSLNDILYNGEDFKLIENYIISKNKNVFFKSLKDCQDYCNWANHRNKIREGLIKKTDKIKNKGKTLSYKKRTLKK